MFQMDNRFIGEWPIHQYLEGLDVIICKTKTLRHIELSRSHASGHYVLQNQSFRHSETLEPNYLQEQ